MELWSRFNMWLLASKHSSQAKANYFYNPNIPTMIRHHPSSRNQTCHWTCFPIMFHNQSRHCSFHAVWSQDVHKLSRQASNAKIVVKEVHAKKEPANGNDCLPILYQNKLVPKPFLKYTIFLNLTFVSTIPLFLPATQIRPMLQPLHHCLTRVHSQQPPRHSPSPHHRIPSAQGGRQRLHPEEDVPPSVRRWVQLHFHDG